MTPEQRAALVAAESALVAGNASLTALSEAVRVLRASLTEADPPPPPPPPGDDDVPIGKIVTETMNLARTIYFIDNHESSRYQRFQKLRVLRASRESIRARCFNMATGGALVPLLGKTYTLTLNGKPAATAAPRTAATHELAFDVDLSGVAPGWLRASITGLGEGETCATWFFFHAKAGNPIQQSFVPIVRGTYELMQAGSDKHQWVKAPNTYAPRVVPMPKRTYIAPDPALKRSGLHCEYLSPMRWGDAHRPNVNKDGIISSFDLQNYAWSTLHAKLPGTALLDGPRGIGCVGYGTHFQIATAVVDGVQRETTYFCDPWRVGKISEDGTVTTLVGYRHKGIPGHWEDADRNLELIGDWSAVPADRRGFWELWGMAWDERTLAIDPSRRIPEERNENPHITGPVMFVPDSQHNRICRIEFSPTAHGIPPKVTEFISAQDPWDCVCAGGVLYVSERKAHRIAAYDATTGALLRVVVQGEPLATITPNRNVILSTSLAAAQAAACVAPEGLFLQDGWLYFASKAQAQVRRVRLDGGGLEVVRPISITGNSEFAKLAISDGTFGPRGATFTWTFSNTHFGGPEIFGPDGVRILPWWNVQSGGTGWWWTTAGYGTAGAVARGRLICANVVEGIYRITRSQPGDAPYSDSASDPRMKGRKAYYEGLHLLHGPNGYGYYGLPLPWGVSSDIDAFLTAVGHTKP